MIWGLCIGKKEGLQRRRRWPGKRWESGKDCSESENLDVADSLRNLSIILGDEGKWAEAEATAREVLAIRTNLLGPEHPYGWRQRSTMLLGRPDARGKLDEAENLEREALAMRQKLLGAEHPDVAESLSDRSAICMRQRGNLNESDIVLSAALSIQRKVLGEDDPETLTTLDSLGSTLEAEGKWPEAEAVHREALAAWRKRAGDEDPQTVKAHGKSWVRRLKSEGKWSGSGNRCAAKRWPCGANVREMRIRKRCLRCAIWVWRLKAKANGRKRKPLWRESLARVAQTGGVEEQQSMYTLRKLGLALEAEPNGRKRNPCIAKHWPCRANKGEMKVRKPWRIWSALFAFWWRRRSLAKQNNSWMKC